MGKDNLHTKYYSAVFVYYMKNGTQVGHVFSFGFKRKCNVNQTQHTTLHNKNLVLSLLVTLSNEVRLRRRKILNSI